MATNLQDAKITVKIDTEDAEARLDSIETRTKKDAVELKKADKLAKTRTRADKTVKEKKSGRIKEFVKSGMKMGSIPYVGTILAVESIVEFALPAMVETIGETMKDVLPDIPVFNDMTDALIGSLEKGSVELSEKLSWLRGKIEAMGMAKEGAMEVIKSQTGLGITIDEDYLIDHATKLFQIGEVQSNLRGLVKKAQAANMGSALRATLKSFVN